MINFKKLNTKENILEDVTKLGDFVGMYKNGKLQEILDMKYGIGINNIMSIKEEDIIDTTGSDSAINIILKNGDIIEFLKENKKYITKSSIMHIIQNQYMKKKVRVIQNYTKGNVSYTDKFYGDFDNVSNLIIDKINYIYSIYPSNELPFAIEEKRIFFKEQLCDSLWFCDEEYEMYCDINDEQWCILELSFGNSVNDNDIKDNKIIMSNKFKQHMLVHQNDFKIPYHNLMKYMEYKGCFNNLKDGFVEMVVEFPFDIGYTSLVETDSTHNIFYAKRKNRDTYSRFTTSGEKRLTNRCVVILNQSYTNSNEYYLVTMFPGEHLIREVQDKNIKSDEERKRILEFWSEHALILNADDIDIHTVTRDCPYTELV